jgi:hypothetical protein
MSNNFITINLYLDEFEDGNSGSSIDLSTYFNTIPRPVSILPKHLKDMMSDDYTYGVPVWRDITEGYQYLSCRKSDDKIVSYTNIVYTDNAHEKTYTIMIEDGKLKYSNNIFEVVKECLITTKNGVTCPISFIANGPDPRPEPGPEDDFGFDYSESVPGLGRYFNTQPNPVNMMVRMIDAEDQNKWYFEISVNGDGEWLECRNTDDEIVKVYVKEANLPSDMKQPYNLRVVGGKLYYSSNASQMVELFIVETKEGIKAPFKLKYSGGSPLPV